ncbi:LAFE_0B02938g1_1 [Lachancea fermentati]|uniref:LAFE_0B02938g1_1 n=1 Tax=Lachancea fermentati TaxID=4955 RepID=A0A1G4M7I5_LACFM|nr:LAFE_0B02938g1_1 [Lachancea fermentati]
MSNLQYTSQFTDGISDENAVPSNFKHHASAETRPFGHRVALSDVTSQINRQQFDQTSYKTSVSHGGRQSQGEESAFQFSKGSSEDEDVIRESYDEDSLTEEENDRTLSSTTYVANDVASTTSRAIREQPEQNENYETSPIETDDEFSDIEPLTLIVNDQTRYVVQAAFNELHRSTPDPLDEDTYDLVMVVEYTWEIFEYLHTLEERYRPHPQYMNFQPELKWSYRSTLIDWIVQVHVRFQLLPETLYLTVNIIDRFLSKKTVTLNRFQLVGAAALFIAAKFEEINCPTVKEILYMLDNSYTKDDLLKAERYMINTLEFELGWPGPMSFLRRVSKADDYEYDIRTLAKYLLETTIMDPRLVSAQPSWLSAAAYYLSRVILGFNEWAKEHVYYSGYTAEQLLPLATVILENCRYARRRHQAIFEKYSERRHRRSAQAVARWIALAEQRID